MVTFSPPDSFTPRTGLRADRRITVSLVFSALPLLTASRLHLHLKILQQAKPCTPPALHLTISYSSIDSLSHCSHVSKHWAYVVLFTFRFLLTISSPSASLSDTTVVPPVDATICFNMPSPGHPAVCLGSTALGAFSSNLLTLTQQARKPSASTGFLPALCIVPASKLITTTPIAPYPTSK